MKGRDKALHLSAFDQRGRKVLGRQRRRDSHVGCLAKLAGSVILAAGVNVASGKDDKEDGECAQRERKKGSGIPSPAACHPSFHHRNPSQGRLDAG
jgi:hypothetical protein